MEIKRKKLFRILIPSYPPFNVYTYLANKTTAMGPILIASSANELPDWEVEVIDENNFNAKNLLKSNGKINHPLLQQENFAQVVGFYGGLSSSIPRLYQLAKFYKESGAVTIAGGQHFTAETIPEALSQGLDCIVLGEGETTIKEFLKAIESKNSWNSIKGIAFRDNGEIKYTTLPAPIQNLDLLPIPDFSLLKNANMVLFPIGRVRGCAMNCEFCSVKGTPRFASAEKLLQQVADNVEKFNARQFFIVDDLFAQDREETLRLCRLLKEFQKKRDIKLRISVQIRLDKAKDLELLSAMKSAGIKVVIIGFESPLDIELKAMRKGLKTEEIQSLSKTYQESGFYIHGMFIFGYPLKERLPYQRSIRETVEYFKKFISSTRLDTLQVVLPVPLPGTELRRRLISEKRVYPLRYFGWEYYDGTFPLFEPDPPFTPQNLQESTLEIMRWFYSRDSYLRLGINSFTLLPFVFQNGFKRGLKEWRRHLRNYWFRAIGSSLIEKWTRQLQKNKFLKRLESISPALEREKILQAT